MWAQGIEGFYLVGDPDYALFCDELDTFTEKTLKPRLYNLGIAWVEISGNEDLTPMIERIYKKRFLESSLQGTYWLKQTN